MKSNKITCKPMLSLFIVIQLIIGSSFFKASADILKNNSTLNKTSSNELSDVMSKVPFKMTNVQIPKFPDKNFNILNYGAAGDGLKKNTEAFTKAINACALSGGGSVVVPSGTWLTGPIELKSNVNLHLSKGALIKFSKQHSDYINIKREGAKAGTAASPIYGYNINNVAITGDGIIDGSGDTWRPVKKQKVTPSQWNDLVKSGGSLNQDGSIWTPGKDSVLRPYMVYILNSQNILIDGPTIKNSPNLTVNITKCHEVLIQNTSVYNEWYAQNTDGIDISACQNVIIFNCKVSTGDDGICMKASKSEVTPALQNVVIANCTVWRGHGGFSVGSNTNGGIKNIYVKNCSYVGTDAGIRFKSPADSGGIVEDIFIDGINMKDIATDAIIFQTSYNNVPADALASKATATPKKTSVKTLPQFQNIHISNVNCVGALKAIEIEGLPDMPVKNIDFNNVVILSKEGFRAENSTGIKLKNVNIIQK